MNEELLCLQVIWGWYQYFMPFYTFSVLESYPSYHVRFVLLDDLIPEVGLLMDEIKAAGYSRFSILRKKKLELREFSGATDMYERWLLDRSYFAGFDYAWIGDIDFLHVREQPTWLEQEIEAAEYDGFPYSNVTREANGPYPDTLTGWHFIIVEPYYDAMEGVIREYKTNPVSMYNPDLGRPMENERLLYYLAKKGIGVRESTDPNRKHTWRMTHGMHLGKYRRNVNGTMPDWCITDQIRTQVKNELFQQLVRKANHPEIRHIMNRLQGDCGVV